jgi:hypothetical protein
MILFGFMRHGMRKSGLHGGDKVMGESVFVFVFVYACMRICVYACVYELLQATRRSVDGMIFLHYIPRSWGDVIELEGGCTL